MKQNSKKPSSAPARISAKDDIWKDIHDWAKPCGSRDDGEEKQGDQTTVIGSQLKDNVTEQRMLEGRLMDLSKERYKFIVQVAWQRKAFVDRQKAKTGVMKDLLNGIDTSQVAAGKGKNYNARMRTRHDTYKNLLVKTYGDQQTGKRCPTVNEKGESVEEEEGLLEMKPIFSHPFKIFKTEVSSKPGNQQKFNQAKKKMLDRRKTTLSFPAIEQQGSSGGSSGGGRTRSQGLITQRQSMPATFLRRDVHKVNAQHGELRETKSASSIPKYLKYRTVYDGRFNKLEKVLCKPYTGEKMDSMRSLLRTLPPAPSAVATPTPVSSSGT
ncbi:uncharacterized protein [Asterias amurensis]|uniref:uncharacterized protein n=1 Tax=Asterias amurensis TaxID=7602 RepID=UPI003AB302B9